MTLIVGKKAKAVELVMTNGAAALGRYSLSEGNTLMVGSGANCGIRLADQAVSSIHCVLRLAEGQVFVQDWCSALGTFVDDERVDEETQVPDGATIQVGTFRLRVQFAEKSATQETAIEAPIVQDADPATITSAEGNVEEDALGDPAGTAASCADAVDQTAGSHDAPIAGDESATLQDPDQSAAVSAARETSSERARRRRSEVNLVSGVDAETIQLLEAEIECLQSELLERDRQLVELQELVMDDVKPVQSADSDELDSLTSRLEQLLDELDGSDARIRALEELLKSEQEVSRAQQEEREQVEAWLGDIERRVASREEEWQAERESLLKRADQLRQERDEADRRLDSIEQNPQDAQSQHAVVKELRESMDALRGQLADSEKQRACLESELQNLRAKSPEQAQQEFIEETLRAERLKLAQEQAALSRERAQLARRVVELEGEVKRERHHEADDRFRAFRQTLKELHNTDQVNAPGSRKASLGTRIADLWRKLDGPTDTD